jgi:hypothetical protein
MMVCDQTETYSRVKHTCMTVSVLVVYSDYWISFADCTGEVSHFKVAQIYLQSDITIFQVHVMKCRLPEYINRELN